MPKLDRCSLVTSRVFCALLICSLTLSANLRAQTQQNGITATQGAAISSLTSGTDYMWAGPYTSCQAGSATQAQNTYFQAVGHGPTSTYCAGSSQTCSAGDCTYAHQVNLAYGQH